ncbi:MAG: PTS sugar transporter subunit IIA [Thermoanaerobaculia bacterium]
MTAGVAEAGLALWIRPEMLLGDLTGENPADALEQIASGMARADAGISARAACAGFLEREALGTTAIGEGFAIPHCRLAGVTSVRMALARHPIGIDFGALDGTRVRAFFALIAPRTGAPAHLEALAAIARFLRDPERRRRVLEAQKTADLLAFLTGHGLDGPAERPNAR